MNLQLSTGWSAGEHISTLLDKLALSIDGTLIFAKKQHILSIEIDIHSIYTNLLYQNYIPRLPSLHEIQMQHGHPQLRPVISKPLLPVFAAKCKGFCTLKWNRPCFWWKSARKVRCFLLSGVQDLTLQLRKSLKESLKQKPSSWPWWDHGAATKPWGCQQFHGDVSITKIHQEIYGVRKMMDFAVLFSKKKIHWRLN